VRVSLVTACHFSTRPALFNGSLKSFIPTTQTNLPTATNRLEKTLTKFWEKVTMKFNENSKHYEILLDGKPLRTPLGFPLAIPESKKSLAYLVVHEWENLPDLKIKTGSLPLTSIVSRSIDLLKVSTKAEGFTEEMEVKVGNLEDIKLNILRYLDTDTCLIFATKEEYEGKLRAKQNELYLPLIKEYEEFFTAYGEKNGLLPEGGKIELQFLDCETHGLRGNKQTITTQNVVLKWLDQVPVYDLVALEKAILTSKSFLCGVTLLRSNCGDESLMKEIYQSKPEYYFKSLEEIIELGNLETIFQTEEWGEVEDTHDVDKVEWVKSLGSAALLSY
jgi:ATP synthase F1 complex assembly factor 2